jgi:glycosyltransferase involved in cell wall biosynthesis
MNVVWLASWYPNRTGMDNGDFIERHALSVAPFVTTLTVIAVIKDAYLKPGQVEIDKQVTGNMTVYIAYYGKSRWGGFAEKLFSVRAYMKLQMLLWKKVVATRGMPDIMHVHIAMKAGLFAKKMKRRFNIPYVVTENWTGYYKASVPNLYIQGRLFTHFNNTVLKHAALFLPVSDNLGREVNANFVKVPYKVVPNVVDTQHFFLKPGETKKIKFIHASYLNYQKNPEGMLAAFKILQAQGKDFEVLFLGNKDERLITLAKEAGLENKVTFEAAVPNSEVAKRMQDSSALLLFSRFENLPCVMLEALCCGLPVISSNVGGVAEVINDSNGILVKSEDVPALAAAMQKMVDHYEQYNRQAISATATAAFCYDAVGKQYVHIYTDILKT